MSQDYWFKQDSSSPLFPELLWSRPENKHTAGKLLIVGGNTGGFAAPAEAYQRVQLAGIGGCRVVLPQTLKRTAGQLLDTVEYAPNTASGSFSKAALATIIDNTAWADGLLIAGDLGRNSETAVMLESMLQKISLPTVITKDAVEYITSSYIPVSKRPDTVLVLSLSQLQRLFIAAKQTQAITLGMDLLHLVDCLHEFTSVCPLSIITHHLDHTFVACGGLVSTTPSTDDKEDLWRVKTAATASVWWIQNPHNTFEALTSSLVAKTDENNL